MPLSPSIFSALIVKNIEDSYPLSPMQQGMLFHSLHAPQSGVDIEQITCAMHEDLNVSAFKRSWQRLVERHPVLRTSFCWEGVNEPIQEVHKQITLPWVEQDWRGVSARQQEKRLEVYLQTDRRRGFELTDAPLMRLALFRVAEAGYQLVWTFHHAVLDGRSFPLVLKELFAFYQAFCQDQELKLEQPQPYRYYIDWLGKQDFIKAESFWRQTLKGFTAPTPMLVDSAYSKFEENSHGKQGIRLTEALTSALQSLAKQHQITLNTLVQGAWALLLSRYSGESDVVFGATRACRRSALKEAESMVGIFINTLPVRARVSPDMLLMPWLKELRAQWLAMRDYEHTPLLKVQGWSDIPSRKPLFDSILVFENYLLNSTLRSLGGSWEHREFQVLEQTNYPLAVIAYVEPELLLQIGYARCQFNDTTIVRMLEHLRTLLLSMVANPEQRLSDLPLLTQAERHQLLVEWNNTQVNYSKNACIHQLFEAQVERNPDAVAVVFVDALGAAPGTEQQLTYRELNRRANRLAHYLQQMDVGPEVLVGICVERSLEMVVGLLGILKAGGAYVPLDPEYPMSRLDFMLQDTQAKILLTQKRLTECLPESMAKVVCLDADWKQISLFSNENPVSNATAENLAYIIYTSGSTGQPKGVMVPHRGVCNHLLWMQTAFELTKEDRVLQKASSSFDVSVLELFWPLLAGLRLILAKPGGHQDSAYLAKLIAEQKITFLHAVPSMLQVLLEEQEIDACKCLRYVTSGAEALPNELKERFFARMSAQLYNAYGPTEASIGVIYGRCNRGSHQRLVPIGLPIANTQIYVLDSRLQPQPIGVPGELYIGGVGLARGYLNQPELSSERFIPDPYNQKLGARLFKTGDLARYQSDGNIEYLGRIDHQVKIRGFRIELGEIEVTLSQHPRVRETVVLAREDISGNKHLVAYFVTYRLQVPTTSELRNFLMELLPNYMVPSIFVRLDALPLTSNGKVDSRALPVPDQERPDLERAFVVPRDTVELQLTQIWSEVLSINTIGVRDNFFDLGGHSLLAVRLFAQIKKIFGKALPLAALFQAATVEQLATILRQSEPALWSPLVAIQTSGSKPPLFCIHEIDGHILFYRKLALYLDAEQPIYGLQAQGLDGKHAPLSRIEDMAALYISKIRTVQPHGPYFLVGYSLGGVIAFEMAQQLQAQGQEVAMLALIDSSLQKAIKLLPFFARLPRHLANFLQLESKEKLTYFQKKLGSRFYSNHTQPLPEAYYKSSLEEAHEQASRNYVPQVYSSQVIIFRASELIKDWSDWYSVDRLLGWGHVVAGGLELHYVPGDHFSMIDEPNVYILAEKLRACLSAKQLLLLPPNSTRRQG